MIFSPLQFQSANSFNNQSESLIILNVFLLFSFYLFTFLFSFSFFLALFLCLFVIDFLSRRKKRKRSSFIDLCEFEYLTYLPKLKYGAAFEQFARKQNSDEWDCVLIKLYVCVGNFVFKTGIQFFTWTKIYFNKINLHARIIEKEIDMIITEKNENRTEKNGD